MHRSTNNGAGREEMSNCEHRPRPNTAIEKLYTLITTGRVFEFQNRYDFGVTRIKKKKKITFQRLEYILRGGHVNVFKVFKIFYV